MYILMKNKPYTFYLHCLLHETQELSEYIFHIVALLATYSDVFYHKRILLGSLWTWLWYIKKEEERGKMEVFWQKGSKMNVLNMANLDFAHPVESNTWKVSVFCLIKWQLWLRQLWEDNKKNACTRPYHKMLSSYHFCFLGTFHYLVLFTDSPVEELCLCSTKMLKKCQ